MHPELDKMKREENNFTIPLAGLPFGHTDYQYVINDSFFEERDYSEVKKGIVNLHLGIEKMETMFVLSMNFEGKVVLQCDRCGDDYEQAIADSAEIYLKYGAEKDDEDEDVIIITKNDSEFDLSDLIYEYIILSLPIHRTHDDESLCNQEVLAKLHNFSQSEAENEDEEENPWKQMMKDLKSKIDK